MAVAVTSPALRRHQQAALAADQPARQLPVKRPLSLRHRPPIMMAGNCYKQLLTAYLAAVKRHFTSVQLFIFAKTIYLT
jgi:hypothetical protein